jgi:hypothetical protein
MSACVTHSKQEIIWSLDRLRKLPGVKPSAKWDSIGELVQEIQEKYEHSKHVSLHIRKLIIDYQL